MRHMVEAIAAQGRNGDDELLHVSKSELRSLKKIGDAIGIKSTVNPRTGLPEAFNWVKPLATIAGGTVGFVASGFNPLGAAAGASLAAGATTAAQGGSTNDVLMSAAISGATAYAGAGIASGLGEAGSAAAETGTEVVGQGAVEGGTSAAMTPNAIQDIATVDAGSGITTLPSGQTLSTPVQNVGPFTGAEPGAARTFTGADIVKGFQNTPGTELIDKYGSKAVGAGIGLGTLGSLPNSYGDTTETEDTGPHYKGETYYDKYGYMRSRAVPMASGGTVLVGYTDEKAAAQGGPVSSFALGGIASMAKGRYLQGPGDGMSDSIPADIDGKQPARLATGEFVVPADVVSHLGNGDSSAGAERLHEMMDRARVARTGTKKQGKQINPRKVMPV